MRRLVSACVVGAFTLVLCSGVAAEQQTVRGEVVDLQCHKKQGAKGTGEAHKDCALACAKKGSPMAILTSSGDVYTISGDYTKDSNAKLIDFVAAKVEATGNVTEADGRKTIDVASMKKQ